MLTNKPTLLKQLCPKCSSEKVQFSEKRQTYVCIDCFHEFTIEKKIPQRRIFLSYGHDEHTALAEQLKNDLQNRGHEVWFDLDRLKPGGDWEAYIAEGLEWVSKIPNEGRFILLMTPHSIRRPEGYCLNEITRALERQLTVIPVMVVQSEPPLSICRTQWLDMRDCVPVQERKEKYEVKFASLMEAVEDDRIDFEGVQMRLIQRLSPLPFEADILPHLIRFTGRKWVFDRIDAWLADEKASRVFWITGKPGVGKTAIAAWLCTNRGEIAAFHLCRHGHVEKSNPQRAILSIAYQLSSQLPGYQEHLNNKLDLEKIITMDSPKTIFDNLIVQPLTVIPRPDRNYVILIDALDEATIGGKNELSSFIASEFDKTPGWLRLIITSRPEPEVMQPLQALTPYVLDASTPENEGDIREYLKRELKTFAGGKEVEKHDIDTIFQKSEGIFLYVEWIRKELMDKRLSLDKLDNFPQGLGAVYAQFFERKFPDIDKFKKTYRPVLELIVSAREPLEIEYFASLFSWSDYDKKEIWEAFGSLFSVSNNRIQPFHKSIIDWLTDRNKAGDYFISAEEGHKRLAEYGWKEYQGGAGKLTRYSVVHLPAHLSLLMRKDELNKLLFDFGWIQGKLDATDANSLIRDFDFLPNDKNLQLVQGAIRLSAHVLVQDKTQLAGQLLGRLSFIQESNVKSMLDKACESKGYIWLRPFKTSLTPPGGPLIRTLEGHNNSVKGVAVMPDGKHAISASSDKTLILWDIETGNKVKTLKGHGDSVNAVVVMPDGKRAISASSDRTLIIWDVDTENQVKTLNGHAKSVNAVALIQNGKRIISASNDRTLKIWGIDNEEETRTLEGHNDWVMSVDLMPDNKHAISASYDGTLKIWDIDTEEEPITLEGHTNSVNAVAVIPESRKAISASYDRTLIVWDIDARKPVRKLERHSDSVNAVAVTPDGGRAVSASKDNTLKVWDIETEKELLILEDHTGPVWAVAVMRDGKSIISASEDKTLKIWNIGTGKQFNKIEDHNKAVRAVALTNDDKRAISASGDNTLIVWDIETGKKLKPLIGHTDWVNAVAVMQDNKTAISASRDNKLIIWNMETGNIVRPLIGHKKSVTAVAIATDGKRAISASEDTTLIVWDIETGEPIIPLEGHTHAVNSVVIMDGRCAISASLDNTLRKWDIETGDRLQIFEGHEGSVRAVAFEQNSGCLISASDDKTLIVWDLKTGKPLKILKGHMDRVRSVALTPDGKRAISASYDNTLKVWDIETEKIITSFNGDRDILSCAVSSDGLTIIAGDRIGRVHMLHLEGAG